MGRERELAARRAWEWLRIPERMVLAWDPEQVTDFLEQSPGRQPWPSWIVREVVLAGHVDPLGYPGRVTCHAHQPHQDWRPRDGQRPYRSCWTCDSIHPADLALAVDGGSVLEAGEEKYGWPDKFYLDVPNPRAGRVVQVARPLPIGLDEAYEEEPRTLVAVWQAEHLLDLAYEPERLDELLALVERETNVRFQVQGGDPGRSMMGKLRYAFIPQARKQRKKPAPRPPGPPTPAQQARLEADANRLLRLADLGDDDDGDP